MDNKPPRYVFDGLPRDDNSTIRHCSVDNHLLLMVLKFEVKEHLERLSVTKGCDNVKVDAVIKSWKESDDWDFIKAERKLVVNFRLDFKSVISYT